MSDTYLGVQNGIRRITIDKSNFINRGGYGEVYRISPDKCAKVYYVQFPVKAKKDTKKVLKAVRNLNIDGMYRIYDFLYKGLEFKGYIMSTHEGISLDKMDKNLASRILDMPTERVIDNLVKLENIGFVLTRHNIMISDDLGSNIIVGPNGFTVVDADSYLVLPDHDRVEKENSLTIRTLEAATPIRAVRTLGLSSEEENTVRENAKRIFFDPNKTLSDKISEIEKEKTLGSLVLHK